jgi:hypothetical protein
MCLFQQYSSFLQQSATQLRGMRLALLLRIQGSVGSVPTHLHDLS